MWGESSRPTEAQSTNRPQSRPTSRIYRKIKESMENFYCTIRHRIKEDNLIHTEGYTRELSTFRKFTKPFLAENKYHHLSKLHFLLPLKGVVDGSLLDMDGLMGRIKDRAFYEWVDMCTTPVCTPPKLPDIKEDVALNDRGKSNDFKTDEINEEDDEEEEEEESDMEKKYR